MADLDPIWLLVAVIFLVALAVTIFVATIVYLQRNTSKKKEPPTRLAVSPPVMQTTPQPPSQAAVQAPSARPAPTESAKMVDVAPAVVSPAHPGEVMRVIRDQQTGRILVQVDGQQYAHIREIKDAQVGRRVLWAVADLLRFTGGMAANPQALQGIARPEETSVPQLQPQTQGQSASVQEQSLPVSTLPPERPMPQPMPRPTPDKAVPVADQPGRKSGVGGTMANFFRRGLQSAPTVQAPRSFIDQIEDILQKRIESLPTPPAYPVHVQTAEDGSLEIQVGNNHYGSPTDVPDPDIRKLIQDSVAEWEKR